MTYQQLTKKIKKASGVQKGMSGDWSVLSIQRIFLVSNYFVKIIIHNSHQLIIFPCDVGFLSVLKNTHISVSRITLQIHE
uniref:Ovule protein n=1 Tax=Heterorhabditis bacteriophora TaxID=37862 RepID=A0A1I7X127_HETBA